MALLRLLGPRFSASDSTLIGVLPVVRAFFFGCPTGEPSPGTRFKLEVMSSSTSKLTLGFGAALALPAGRPRRFGAASAGASATATGAGSATAGAAAGAGAATGVLTSLVS